MVSLFMIIWGADLLFLPAHSNFPLRISFVRCHRVFFVLVVFLWGLSVRDPSLHSLFSGVMFFALMIYAVFRRKAETVLLRQIRGFAKTGPQDSGKDSSVPQTPQPVLMMLFPGVLIVWFCGMLIMSVGLSVVMATISGADAILGQTALLSVLAGIWMIVLIGDLCRRTGMYDLTELLGVARKRISPFPGVVVPLVLGWFIALATSFVLVFRVQQPVTPFSEWMDWAQPSWAFGAFVFAALVTGPFLEEVIFRGFFFQVIQDLKNTRWAFWIVAASFGLLHVEQYWGDVAAVAIIFVIGIVLGLLRKMTGSVWSGVIMHYTFNIFMVVLPGALIMASHPVFARYSMGQDTLSWPEKEVLLEGSISEDARNSMAYYELAGLYLDHDRDLDKALHLIEEALTINPGRTLFEYLRGKIFYAMGHPDKALEIFEEILQSSPENRDVAQHIEKIRIEIVSEEGFRK